MHRLGGSPEVVESSADLQPDLKPGRFEYKPDEHMAQAMLSILVSIVAKDLAAVAARRKTQV